MTLLHGLYGVASLAQQFQQSLVAWQMAGTYGKECGVCLHDVRHLGCPIGISVVY